MTKRVDPLALEKESHSFQVEPANGLGNGGIELACNPDELAILGKSLGQRLGVAAKDFGKTRSGHVRILDLGRIGVGRFHVHRHGQLASPGVKYRSPRRLQLHDSALLLLRRGAVVLVLVYLQLYETPHDGATPKHEGNQGQDQPALHGDSCGKTSCSCDTGTIPSSWLALASIRWGLAR